MPEDRVCNRRTMSKTSPTNPASFKKKIEGKNHVRISETPSRRLIYRSRMLVHSAHLPAGPYYKVILDVVHPRCVSLSSVTLCPHPTRGSHARAVKFTVRVTFAQASSLSRDNVPSRQSWRPTYIFQKQQWVIDAIVQHASLSPTLTSTNMPHARYTKIPQFTVGKNLDVEFARNNP